MQGLWLVSARQHQSLQCYTFFFFTSESILTTLHVFFTRQNPSFFLHVSSRCSSEPIVTTLHVFFHIRTHRFFLHVSTHCFFFHVSTHCCTPREHCTSRNSVRFPQGIHFLCQLLSPALLSSPVMSCHVLSCPVLSCPSSLPLLHTLALSSLSLSLSIYLSIYIYIYIYIYISLASPPLSTRPFSQHLFSHHKHREATALAAARSTPVPPALLRPAPAPPARPLAYSHASPHPPYACTQRRATNTAKPTKTQKQFQEIKKVSPPPA